MSTIPIGSSHTSDFEPRIAESFPNGKLLKRSSPGWHNFFSYQFFHWEMTLRFAVQNQMCGMNRVRLFTQRNGYYFSKTSRVAPKGIFKLKLKDSQAT